MSNEKDKAVLDSRVAYISHAETRVILVMKTVPCEQGFARHCWFRASLGV